MRKRDQGYVLLAAVMGMVVVMALLTVMIMTSVSESSQSGSQGGLVRARAAAEAGVSDANFYLTNQGLSDINAVLNSYATAFAASNNNAATTPIITNTSAARSSIAAIPGMSGSNALNGANYSYTIRFTDLNADNGSFNLQGQQYYLNYTIVSVGSVGSYKRTVSTSGLLRVQMGRKYLNQYVLLANDGGSQQGNYFITGMDYDGPVHIAGNWLFYGYPTFSMGAETEGSSVKMQTCGGQKLDISTQTGPDACTQPNWNGRGIQYSAPTARPPSNGYQQAYPALGIDTSSMTAAQRNQAPSIGTICTNLVISPCPGSTAALSDGVYVARSGSSMNGGIYIKGNASVKLSVNNGKQVYTLVDSQNRTTTITVDYAAATTQIVSPSNVTTLLSGVPNGQLYSTGSLTVTGPARTGPIPSPPPDTSVPSQIPPAVASNSKLNLTAEGDMVINSDLTYQDDPRSVSGATNVLGLISGSGNMRVGSSAPNDVYIQAALLSGASGKGFNVDNYGSGSARGSIHLLGSLAEDQEPPRGVFAFVNNAAVIQHGYGDAFHFDQRFLNGGNAPPFFPTTSTFAANASWPEQQTWREQ